jgi:hypothetical protein
LRRQLTTRWPWLALLIAIVVGLPSITGQLHWHWPFFAQMAALKGAADAVTPRIPDIASPRMGRGALLL